MADDEQRIHYDTGVPGLGLRGALNTLISLNAHGDLDGEGAEIGGQAHRWSDFDGLELTGGPFEPELLRLTRIDGEPVVLLCTEAWFPPIEGVWTPDDLRAFAQRVAALSGLPLADELGDEDSWGAEVEADLVRRAAKAAATNPRFKGLPEEPPGVAWSPEGIELRLTDNSVDAIQVLRITPTEIHGRKIVDLAVIDSVHVVFQPASFGLGGPADAHRAVVWARTGTTVHVLFGRVVLAEVSRTTPEHVLWVAEKIREAVARVRPQGSQADVPKSLDALSTRDQT